METQQPEPKYYDEYRLFPALIVIAIGVIFLISNLGVKIPFFDSSNWWAWLILAAAATPLSRAYRTYHARGVFDAEVTSALVAGSAMVLVAVMFLLGLDWSVWWPLFVILGGVFMMVRGPYRGRYRHHRRSRHENVNGTDDATFQR